MLYLVTNRYIANKKFLEIIEEAVVGGVDRVILREKDLGFNDLFNLSKAVKKITDKYDVPLIINGNIEVARKVNAYGFQCGFKDFICNDYKYSEVIGVSIHSVDEGIVCEEKGVSYVLAGHIFETDCKRGLAPRGLNFLKELKENVSVPIVAIGGIDEKNANIVLDTGVAGVAVMSYIMGSMEPYKQVRLLKSNISKK